MAMSISGFVFDDDDDDAYREITTFIWAYGRNSKKPIQNKPNKTKTDRPTDRRTITLSSK